MDYTEQQMNGHPGYVWNDDDAQATVIRQDVNGLYLSRLTVTAVDSYGFTRELMLEALPKEKHRAVQTNARIPTPPKPAMWTWRGRVIKFPFVASKIEVPLRVTQGRMLAFQIMTITRDHPELLFNGAGNSRNWGFVQFHERLMYGAPFDVATLGVK